MRLAVVTHVIRENDGQGKVNFEVVRAALDRGWTVILFAAEIAPELQTNPKVTWVRIGYGPLPSNLLRYQWFAMQSFIEVSRRRSQFDLLQVNGFITWARADVNAVHFVHHGWYHSGYFPYSVKGGFASLYQVCYTRLNMLFEKFSFRRSATIISVSNRVKDELRAEGIQGPVDVIYNGVGLERFAAATRDRVRFALPEDKFLLLFAGDIKNARKNLDTVLRAMPHLPKDIELAVAGGTKGSPNIELAKQLGVADRVHFLGHMKDIPELMVSADLFVFPSRYDPFALVVPEAMAAGIPVVTSVRAGASELLNGAGFVLEDPDDVEKLVAAVTAIYEDPVLLQKMKGLALEGARALGWRTMAERYLDVYERTLNDRQQGVPFAAR